MAGNVKREFPSVGSEASRQLPSVCSSHDDHCLATRLFRERKGDELVYGTKLQNGECFCKTNKAAILCLAGPLTKTKEVAKAMPHCYNTRNQFNSHPICQHPLTLHCAGNNSFTNRPHIDLFPFPYL